MPIYKTKDLIKKQTAILKEYQSGNIEIVKTGRDHIDATLSGLLPGDIVVIAGASGCVDNITEYFNGFKWKPIPDYEVGEKVLQYNPDGTANLVTPLEYIKKEATEFYLFKTKYGVNQCVSEEHNLVYLSSKGNINKKSTLDLIKQHEASIYGFSGLFITTFKYNKKADYLPPNFLRLAVAIQADGHYPNPNFFSKEKGGYRIIIRIKKDRKKEALRELLELNNIEYKEKDTSDNPKTIGFSVFTFYFPEYIKTFPSHWYNLTNDNFETIFKEIPNWDGSRGKGNRLFSYSTNNKSNADFIQFISTSLGFRTRIYEDSHRGNINYIVRPTSQIYCSISSDNKMKIVKQEARDGFKYCFTVPSGMLVLRREGVINITGNSGKSFELQTLRENIMNTKINPNAENYIFLDYSFEMKLFNLILRGISKVLGKGKREILLGSFTDKEKPLANRYITTLSDDRFFIDEIPCTAEEYLAQTKEFLEEHRDKEAVFVAIDHMALFKSSGDKKLSIDKVVEGTNLLKREFPNAYFIFLTQLNRGILGRIKDRDINAMPNRSDIFQSDTMFHIADYLIVVHNPHRLGISDYLRINPRVYSMLSNFFSPDTGKSRKASFKTFGNIFYHVLKVREGEISFQDIYIESIQEENIEIYQEEVIDVISEDFDELNIDTEEDKF